jgi:hypothetical protein
MSGRSMRRRTCAGTTAAGVKIIVPSRSVRTR